MQTITLNEQFEILNEQKLNTIYGGTTEQEEDTVEIIYINGHKVVIKKNSDGSITILEGM